MQSDKYDSTEAPTIMSPMISEAAFSQLQELYKSSAVDEPVTELGVLSAQEQSPASSKINWKRRFNKLLCRCEGDMGHRSLNIEHMYIIAAIKE